MATLFCRYGKSGLTLEVPGDALEVLRATLVRLVIVRTDVHGHEVHVTPRCGWGGRRRRRSRGGLGSRGAVTPQPCTVHGCGDKTQSCKLELDRKVAAETVMMDPC